MGEDWFLDACLALALGCRRALEPRLLANAYQVDAFFLPSLSLSLARLFSVFLCAAHLFFSLAHFFPSSTPLAILVLRNYSLVLFLSLPLPSSLSLQGPRLSSAAEAARRSAWCGGPHGRGSKAALHPVKDPRDFAACLAAMAT